MSALLGQADATRLPLATGSVDMVFTSPPYADARTYGIGAQRKCDEWVQWMLKVVTELTRVCSGLVLVNCAGVTRDRCYWPACEGLMWEWWKQGGNLWRPAYWHRVGIPGSGGKQWLRADIEYVLCFKRDAEWLPWSDNTANGHPPKWAPGGEMAHRLTNGQRVNQWGPVGGPRGGGGRNADGTSKPSRMQAAAENGYPSHIITQIRPVGAVVRKAISRQHTKSRADGTDEIQDYTPPVLANPGCLVKGIKVGGGLLGSKLAHENEAPFPEALAEWFIKGWAKPGGIVLDPFSGSGTTVSVARRLGRKGIGFDLRMNQCELGTRRLAEPLRINGKRPRPIVTTSEPSLFAETA